MAVEHVEFLVEEPSMEALVRAIVPQLLGDNIGFGVYQFQCKRTLLSRIPQRLRAYAKWLPQAWRIMVVVDRDNDDCHELKSQLEEIARSAGLMSKSRAEGDTWSVVNRLAIEELEAWFFGDMDAVRAAYPRVSPNVEKKARYRRADAISGGTWEALESLLQRCGYFKGGLRKVEAARDISLHMNPDRNRSRSFCAFRDAVRAIAAS